MHVPSSTSSVKLWPTPDSPAVRDLSKGVVDELTKVSSRALKQFRWDPVLFLVAEPLKHPLLE